MLIVDLKFTIMAPHGEELCLPLYKVLLFAGVSLRKGPGGSFGHPYLEILQMILQKNTAKIRSYFGNNFVKLRVIPYSMFFFSTKLEFPQPKPEVVLGEGRGYADLAKNSSP